MKIEVLFPEICNLFGDLMNVEYLKRSCPEIEVINTGLKDEPLFVSEKPDMIYMGTMSESSQELVIKKLLPYKNRIMQLIAENALFLITGTALEVFGKTIENEDGTKIDGIGVFSFTAKRKMMARYNSLYLGSFGEMDIVGFKSQFTFAYGADETKPLFKTVRGDGMNKETKAEGLRYNNFMATYVIGPLTVLNPPFASYLLKMMGAENCDVAYHDAAYEVYNSRVKEYKDPNTGFIY